MEWNDKRGVSPISTIYTIEMQDMANIWGDNAPV